jgi:hypothetical protein
MRCTSHSPGLAVVPDRQRVPVLAEEDSGDQRVDGRCGRRIVGEALVHLRRGAIDGIANADLVGAGTPARSTPSRIWISLRQHVAGDEVEHRLPLPGAFLGKQACAIGAHRHCGGRDQAHQQGGGDGRPHAQAGALAGLAARAALVFNVSAQFLLALGMALVERAQARGEHARIEQTLFRIQRRGLGDVLAQQRIVESGLPARCQRAAQVTDQQLVQQHAQCVDVAALGRHFAGDHFRSDVEQAAGLR